ncbi:MAG TPA: ATP-binding protein [Usitatibacteraceae bacterium]|nr:ATP-binding protein [Usitatibacteraceae bacterium]
MAGPAIHEACFAARLESLGELRRFLEQAAGSAGLNRTQALKLQLIAEELFVNTVRHGHGGGDAALVWVVLEVAGPSVRLDYIDQAPPFNSLTCAVAPLPAGTGESHRVGGLGVRLVRELTCSAEYAFLFGRNHTRLVLAG